MWAVKRSGFGFSDHPVVEMSMFPIALWCNLSLNFSLLATPFSEINVIKTDKNVAEYCSFYRIVYFMPYSMHCCRDSTLDVQRSDSS